MASEWKEIVLGDVLELITKGTTPPKGKGFVEKGINFIKSESISYDGQIDESKFAQIDNETHTKFKRSQIKENDILFSMAGIFLGKNAVVKKKYLPANTNQALAIIRVDKSKACSQFISYCLRNPSMVAFVNNMSAQSAQPNINFKEISSLPINLPSITEQTAIAHVLRSLDDKIELNRQMNQTLEQMAQAIFKSWFVDFDPVIDNALAQGNEIPEELQERAEQRLALGENRKPLPEHIQKLFPSEFEFSVELDKWIPKGWRVGKISDISEVIGGGTPSTKVTENFCDDGIPWLSPKDLSGYEWKYISKGATDITELGLKNSSAKLMPKGTVLFSSRAPIGYVAIAENEICTNQGFKSLVPKEGICSDYLFYFLKSNIENIEAIATGSTFKEVSGTAIKNFEILIPDIKILQSFDNQTKYWNEKSFINHKEQQSLTKLRDTLLPKLISGEVRVSDLDFENLKKIQGK